MPNTLKQRGLEKRRNEFANSVSGYIKRFREDSGISLADMARIMRIAISTQWRRENGKGPFTIHDLLSYAEALNCQPADLLP